MKFDPKPYHQSVLLIALNEFAQAEVPGAGNNARIIEYHQATSLRAKEDSVPWCSSFCCWVTKKAGLKTTPANAWAESWIGWGAKSAAIPGAVVVLKNHVGFVVRETKSVVYCLGGNQSDAVNIKAYPISKVLAYRVARAEDVTPVPTVRLAALRESGDIQDLSAEEETA